MALTLTRKVSDELGAWATVLFHVATYPLFAASRTRRQSFRAAREALRQQIPSVPLAKVVNRRLTDAAQIVLKAVPERLHNCSIFELFTLAALTRAVNPSLCLEIGTYDGRSALALAANSRPETKVLTLNLPPDYFEQHPEESQAVDVQLSVKVKSGERWAGHEEGKKIGQIFGHSLEFDFTTVGRPQLVFIDGAHDRLTVASDTKNVLQIIDRENGIIIWHDARDFGVRPVLSALHREGFPVRIIEHTNMAILEFKSGQPASFT